MEIKCLVHKEEKRREMNKNNVKKKEVRTKNIRDGKSVLLTLLKENK